VQICIKTVDSFGKYHTHYSLMYKRASGQSSLCSSDTFKSP